MRSALRPQAFTLIELLIVVAIIAILAAIAVPNFLEAQTRSKVARVKADFRTLTVGFEAYRVDNNRYPIPSTPEGGLIVNPRTASTVSPFETRSPILLTTPIAYLTSLTADPFAVTRAFESPLYHCYVYDYVDLRQRNAPLHNWVLIWQRFFLDLRGTAAPPQVSYLLVSWGPDKDHDADVPHTVAPVGPHTHGEGTVYDPTNGTLSSGDILYAGPGYGYF